MKASQILTVVGFLRASMAIPQYLPEGEYRPECPAPEYTKDVVEQRTRGPTSITGAFCPNPCEMGREKSLATTVEVSVSGGISLDFVKVGGLNLGASYSVSNTEAEAISTVLHCTEHPGCYCGVTHTDYIQYVKGTRTTYSTVNWCDATTEPYEVEVPITQPNSKAGNNAVVKWDLCISSRSGSECKSTLARCPHGL